MGLRNRTNPLGRCHCGCSEEQTGRRVAQVKITDMEDNNQSPIDVTRVQSCWLRQIHEFIFSLNVALGAVLGVVFGYDGVFVPFFRLEELIYHGLGLKGRAEIAGHSAFFLCVMLLTALLFLLLRWFRWTSVVDGVLIYIAGFLALGVAPACWLYIRRRYGCSWYPAEIAVYLLFAMLFLFQKWTIPAFVTILIVCIHYGFWYLRFWEYPHSPVEILAPIVGFCACLAWGMYVPRARARVGLAAPSVN